MIALLRHSLLLLAVFFNNQSSYIPYCGGADRWDVKTLQDADASKVKMKAIKTSVESLTKKKRPDDVGEQTPRFAAEMKTYTVLAFVKDYFTEGDDDIHIVLQDVKDTTITMIAEMPDYDCDKVKDSPFIAKFKKARDHFKSFKRKDLIGHKFFFTGVAFFDLTHGTPQRGVAPNGIELHPVLNFH
jgi:hypothetical protein